MNKETNRLLNGWYVKNVCQVNDDVLVKTNDNSWKDTRRNSIMVLMKVVIVENSIMNEYSIMKINDFLYKGNWIDWILQTNECI